MSQCTTYQYRAQTTDGSDFNGTLEATDVQQANEQLASLGLTVLEMTPASQSMLPWVRRKVSTTDWQMFNEQLVSLTKSGMPVEQGLRLIAKDLGSSKLKTAITHITEELDRGRSLAEAFASQKQHFPPMYAKLVEVGMNTGRLPDVLYNLGQHLRMVGQLKASLTRTFSYPLIVLLFFFVLMFFVVFHIVPQFEVIFTDFDTSLPGLTIFMLQFSRWATGTMPGQFVPGFFWLAFFPAMFLMIAFGPMRKRSFDWMLRYLPFVGAVQRRNIVSRWCDAVRIGVHASMDLPQAMQLASDLIGQRSVVSDTQQIIDCMEQGRPFSTIGELKVIPQTVLSTIELSENSSTLEMGMQDLASMYHQQATLRLISMEAFLTPAMLIILGFFLGQVIIGLMLPMVKLISNLT